MSIMVELDGNRHARIAAQAGHEGRPRCSRPPHCRVAGRSSAGTPRRRGWSRARTGGKCTSPYSRLDNLTPVIFVATGGKQSCGVAVPDSWIAGYAPWISPGRHRRRQFASYTCDVQAACTRAVARCGFLDIFRDARVALSPSKRARATAQVHRCRGVCVPRGPRPGRRRDRRRPGMPYRWSTRTRRGTRRPCPVRRSRCCWPSADRRTRRTASRLPSSSAAFPDRGSPSR